MRAVAVNEQMNRADRYLAFNSPQKGQKGLLPRSPSGELLAEMLTGTQQSRLSATSSGRSLFKWQPTFLEGEGGMRLMALLSRVSLGA